jgi:hypothetical protein
VQGNLLKGCLEVIVRNDSICKKDIDSVENIIQV